MTALQSSRRGLFGVAAFAALPVSELTASPAHPDAALFGLCRTAHATTAARREWDDKPYIRTETEEEEEADIAECLRRCGLQDVALAAVIAKPALTLAGCIAKAAVTAEILDYEVRELRNESFEAQAWDHYLLSRSLAQDLMRMVGSAVA